jgi:cell division protein FtsQ
MAKLNTKKIISTLLWSLTAITIVVLLLASVNRVNNTLVSDVKVIWADGSTHQFLSINEVKNIIGANNIVNKQPVSSVDTKMIEQNLVNNPWIESAEVYFDRFGSLNIVLNEEEPIVRVLNDDGETFYLNKTGAYLPFVLSKTVRLPVLSGLKLGDLNANKSKGVMATLVASKIINSEFWNAQVQMIGMDKDNKFTLYPTVGNHTIIIGDTSNLDTKLARLEKYYTVMATKIGVDQFKTLDAQYANQIVAVRNNTKPVNLDSTKVTNAIRNFLDNNAANQFLDTSYTAPAPIGSTPVVRQPIDSARPTNMVRDTQSRTPRAAVRPAAANLQRNNRAVVAPRTSTRQTNNTRTNRNN